MVDFRNHQMNSVLDRWLLVFEACFLCSYVIFDWENSVDMACIPVKLKCSLGLC